uniref:Uncharacterized protein n=1 Tax=Anguilla anguilla TaxID=7936 RepID=A0A0E9XQQ3_ANGAN
MVVKPVYSLFWSGKQRSSGRRIHPARSAKLLVTRNVAKNNSDRRSR